MKVDGFRKSERNAENHNQEVERSSNAERQQRELDNNPNFFYNEELFLQQAMQQSLLESQPDQRRETEEEIFNKLLKETEVISKKEYDDIGRKMNEEELQKIRNDPTAMKNKLQNLLSKNTLNKVNNKLPPLEFSGTGAANKGGLKRDLTSIKAPILQGPAITDRSNHLHGKDTNKNGNDTDSEIDIHEEQEFK